MARTLPISFLKQTIKAFHTTGALAPSSRFLAKAMADGLPKKGSVPDHFRVLEVGPGTGSVTLELAGRMDGHGHLDLWEINEFFVEKLRLRMETEESFRRMRSRCLIHLGDVRDLARRPIYDAIISGLPFNNFTGKEVREFLELFRAILKPEGTLSFFEYIAIRRIQTPFVGPERRSRLRDIAGVVRSFSSRYQAKQSVVPLNLPPARVRHLRFGKGSTQV